MIIFEKPTVVITYDRDRAMVCQKWTGYTPPEDFREAVDSTFNFLSEKALSRVLSDITRQKVVSPHEQDYTKDAAAAYYCKNNNLRIAFITEPKSVAMACASRYNSALIREIRDEINSFFVCEEDALGWLLNDQERDLPGNSD